MKNIFLSVVVISVLAAAGIGGTLADFSDIETSQDNFFKTGSLDLKVSDYNGEEYQDPNVPAFFQVHDAWPCCDKSIFFDLENYGQGFQKIPHAYLHIKNLECGWVVPKNVWHWVICDGEECEIVPAPVDEPPVNTQGYGYPKPLNEPEYVAECGGIAGEDVDGNKVVVPGIGCCYGEDCELPRHLTVYIWVAGPYPEDEKPPTSANVPIDDWEALDLSKCDTDPANGVIKLNELECVEIYLGELPNNSGMWVHVALHLQDIPEEYFGMDYFDDDSKWNDWPTNALQKDFVEFDMSFELLQTFYADP